MTTLEMTQQDLTQLVSEAVAAGIQSGIELALKQTQTTPIKPVGRKAIRLKDVMEMTGLKESAIRRRYKLEKDYENVYDPKFPKPHKKGGATNFWYLDQIEAWNNQQSEVAA